VSGNRNFLTAKFIDEFDESSQTFFICTIESSPLSATCVSFATCRLVVRARTDPRNMVEGVILRRLKIKKWVVLLLQVTQYSYAI